MLLEQSRVLFRDEVRDQEARGHMRGSDRIGMTEVDSTFTQSCSVISA